MWSLTHSHSLSHTNTHEHTHAPSLTHTLSLLQDYIRKDYTEWLLWLKEEMGFDGWRLDFVRGITGAIWKK